MLHLLRQRKQEFPILLLGLDAAGKSTVLYGLKLGEVVTQVPTIGFNLETIEHKGLKINCWDVGGCDKIRPLWRHFTEVCAALVFVVDANDRERLATARQELEDVMRDMASGVPVLVLANKQDLPNSLPAAEMARLMWLTPPPQSLQPQQQYQEAGEGSLPVPGGSGDDDNGGDSSSRTRPSTAGDHGGAAPGSEGPAPRGDERYFRELMSRHEVHVQPTCALRLFGVYEGLDWLAGAVDRARKRPSAADASTSSNAMHGGALGLLRAALPGWRSRQQAPATSHPAPAGIESGAGKRIAIPSIFKANAPATAGPVLPTAEERLSGWLAEPLAQAPGDSDDAFLAALEACKPGVRWDHFGHLRLAWLYLVRYGRAEGQRRIFESVQRYIQHGVVGGSGRTFHTTMTFFWMHMVHHALACSELHTPMVRTSFRAFLIANPHLADGGLFLRHYSRARMLQDPAARAAVLLPDLQPLPSLVTDVEAKKQEQARERRKATVAAITGIGSANGAPRLLVRAAGAAADAAAAWRARGDRSRGGRSISLRRGDDVVLESGLRRSSTGGSTRSVSSGGGGERWATTGAAAQTYHQRLPAAAAAAARDEDLLAAVLSQPLGKRSVADAAATADVGRDLSSIGTRQGGPGGGSLAASRQRGDGDMSGGEDLGTDGRTSSWPAPLLSGWGSDTLPRVAYAAIKHHGYTRAMELLQAAATASAAPPGALPPRSESSSGGTLGHSVCMSEEPAEVESMFAHAVEAPLAVHGSLLGMPMLQLEQVVRGVARRMARALHPACPVSMGSRTVLAFGASGVKHMAVANAGQGDCSDDDEWLDAGDCQSWASGTAAYADTVQPLAVGVDKEDAALEDCVGAACVQRMRAALPQFHVFMLGDVAFNASK